MTLRSQRNTTRITRFILAAMLLIAASLDAAAQTTNTFPGSGNAGVGTTTPALQSGITNTMIEVKGTVNPGVGLTSTAAGGRQYFVYSSQTNPGYFSVFDATAGADRFVISNSGNVGIGTATPGAKLEVDGSGLLRVTEGSRIVPATGVGLELSADSGGSYVGAYNRTTSAYRRLYFYGSPYVFEAGNVGIGTTNPLAQLHVGTGLNAGLKTYTSSETNHGFLFSSYIDTVNIPYRRYGDIVAMSNQDGISGGSTIRFLTNPHNSFTALERMRIDYVGKVGIGTNNPAYKLHVQDGQINASGGLCINGECKSSWSEVGGSQWSGSSNIFYNTGNVGIGTDSPGAGGYGQSRFDVVGRLRSRATDVNITAGLWLNDSPSAVGATDQAFIGRSPAATTGVWNVTGGWVLNVHDNGKVGIGKSDPTVALDVQGDIKASGTIHAKYQDLAEWVPTSEQLSAGTVVVLDTNKSNQVISSTASYDTRVAGVISAQPGITLGEGGEGKVLVATTGRVRVKVDASRGAIQIGDLLVTSEVTGVAMKSQAVNLGGVQIHRPGTIIGKALEPLAKGTGEILVLLSLQ